MYFCCVKILRKNTWLFITCVRKLIICYTVKSLFAEIHILWTAMLGSFYKDLKQDI